MLMLDILEERSPEVITWSSLVLTGFDKYMCMLCYELRSTLDHTNLPERPFQPKAGCCLK